MKQEEEEVICIKDEPEDKQEVMTALLLDCQVEQGHVPQPEVKVPLRAVAASYFLFPLSRSLAASVCTEILAALWL